MIPIGISDVMEVLKKISKAAENLKNKELNEAIIELQSKVMSVQQEIIRLNTENEELKQKLQEKEQYNMVFENNAYWDLKVDGTKEGPYCSACWGNNGKAIRMDYREEMENLPQRYLCPICQHLIKR